MLLVESLDPQWLQNQARAAADAGAGGIFIRDLCQELALLTDIGLVINTTDLICDSESTIKVLQDVFACKRSKSFITDVKSVRDWVLRLIYRFVKIKTALHHADAMTKPLAVGPFLFHRDAILNAKLHLPTPEAAEFSSYFVNSQVYVLTSASIPYKLVLDTTSSSIPSPTASLTSSSSPSLVTATSSYGSSTLELEPFPLVSTQL